MEKQSIYEEDEFTQKVRGKVKCCACGVTMQSSKHINLIALERKSTWKYPECGNVLTGEKSRASAIICDECLKQNSEIKYAVEWDESLTSVKYHDVNKLEIMLEPKVVAIEGKWNTRQIWIDGNELFPQKSQQIRNHSPDGFNWGYGGSGPAQLALAILLEVAADKNIALANYQDFKWNIIAALPQNDFATILNLDTWIKSNPEVNSEERSHTNATK